MLDHHHRPAVLALIGLTCLGCVIEGQAEPRPDTNTQLVHMAQTTGALAATSQDAPRDAADDGVPEHMLSFFAGETCPVGWREVEEARGRALLGTTDPGRVARVHDNTPAFAARTAPEHVHLGDGATTSEPGKAYFTGAGGCSNAEPFEAMSHGLEGGHIKPATANLPFVHQRLCEKLSPGAQDRLPYASHALFNRPSCPSGWTRVDECPTCQNLNGRTVVPLREGFTIKSVGQPWLVYTSGDHTHTFSGSLTPGEAGLAALSGTNYRAAQGELTFSGTTNGMTGARPLPTIEFLACAKTEMADEGAHPPNMTIFYGGEKDCPEGWQTTAGTAGRFIIASPAGDHDGVTFGSATPLGDGDDRTHVHAFSVSFELTPAHVCLIGGGLPIARSGTYTIDGHTAAAAAGVPYVQLRQCTYTGQR